MQVEDGLSFGSMFMLGLLGTGHCLGMCGPLVLALPARIGKFSAHLLYNLGRILTYTLVGAVLGAIGAGFGTMKSVTEVQFVIAVVAAVFMVAMGLSRLHILPEPEWMVSPNLQKVPFYGRVLRQVLVGKKSITIFAAGLLLGFIPCGLSYGAFAMALPSGGPLEGGLLVLAFGLGTYPGLVLLGSTAAVVFKRYRRASDVISGLLLIGMAVWLLVKLPGPGGCHG